MAARTRTTMNSESQDERDRKELDVLVENIYRILQEEDEKVYSSEVIAEFRNPTRAGRVSDADASGIADGLCSDTMEFYLNADPDRIRECWFYTDGCGASIACGNRLARFVEGMDIDSAWSVRPSDLISLLNGLPPDHEHCAALAVLALRNALRNLEEKRRVEKRGIG